MRDLLKRCWVALPCLLAIAGCAEKDGIAPVSGKVTLRGKPVSNASVAFYPSEKGAPSSGTTKEDGTFELTVTGVQGVAGAKVGIHKVTVSAFKELGPKKKAVDSGLGSIAMDAQPQVMRKSLLPIKYANMRTTDLSFEVKAGEDNIANFEL